MGVDLRIWLLGGFRVTVDGSPVADGSWRRNKAKAVVKLLALASGHRLQREQLMEVLRPDLAPEAAAGNLRKAVYFARQALAPEHLRGHGEMLRLEAPRLWIDVEAFEAAPDAADLDSAVELYGDGGGLELRARRLVGLASNASPGQPQLQGPMIGRDAELGVLLSFFDEVVASGQPRLLHVVGSAGVGKSRLVAEASAMAARRPGMLVLRGRCPSAGRGITCWALGELLREACGVSLADPLATSQDKCSKGLREILGRLGPSGDLDATVFALAATAGVNLPREPARPARAQCGGRRAGKRLAPVRHRLHSRRPGAAGGRGPALGGRGAAGDPRAHGGACDRAPAGGSGGLAGGRRVPAPGTGPGWWERTAGARLRPGGRARPRPDRPAGRGSLGAAPRARRVRAAQRPLRGGEDPRAPRDAGPAHRGQAPPGGRAVDLRAPGLHPRQQAVRALLLDWSDRL